MKTRIELAEELIHAQWIEIRYWQHYTSELQKLLQETKKKNDVLYINTNTLKTKIKEQQNAQTVYNYKVQEEQLNG